MAKNIVFVGLMGSGKTTIGELTAKKLDRKFIDTDDLIEKLAHKSINKIFEQDGEDFFRDLESRIIKEISLNSDQIISTGGGAVENPDNIENLKRNSVIIYLQAPASELYSRIKDAENRPLLKNSDALSVLENLLIKRESIYNLADIKINTVNKQFEEIADKIILLCQNDLL